MRVEWGELAGVLDISRTMLHYVRRGERSLSLKAIRRLEQAEQHVGLALSEPSIIHAYNSRPAAVAESAPESETAKRKSVKIGALMAALDRIDAELKSVRRAVAELTDEKG